VANVALDRTFIFVFGEGVEGAAWASVAAQGTGVAALVLAERRAGTEFLITEALKRNVGTVFSVGAPMGIQMLLEAGSFATLAVLIAGFGEMDLAAHQIALQVIHFTFLPAVAVSEAASVLAGHAVGARRSEMVAQVSKAAMTLAGGYAVLCTALLVLFGWEIAGQFTQERNLRAAASHLLLVAALFQFVDAANVVARGILRGTGDVRFATLVVVITAWICRPPLTYLLGHVAGLGVFGGWFALTVEIFIGAGIFWLRIRGGRWRAMALR